jgi:fibronectin type 3 domain-containing protein
MMRAEARLLTALVAGALLAACDSGLRIELGRRGLAPVAAVVPAPDAAPTADLPAPPGLRARSGELRAVPLTWDPLLFGDVAGYLIERAPGEGAAFARAGSVAGRLATLYVDRGDGEPGGLGDGFTAWYRVRAYTGSGQVAREASPAVQATTAPPPRPPSDLRAFSLQPRLVPLSWRASPDATVAGYVLYRSPTERGPYEPIAEPSSRDETAYVDHGLGELRVFYYRVAARNGAGGEGPPSEPVRAVTKPEPLPPLGLRIGATRLGANELGWEPNVERDLLEYRLLRLREGADAPELVTAVPAGATSAVDAEVASGERVTYTLVAVDRDGLDSAASLPLVVESEDYGLAAELHSDGVQLTWKGRADEGHRGARILRGGRFTRRELSAVDGESYVDTDVKPGGRYRYVVVLERSDGGDAPPSAPVEIAVPGD